MTYITCWTRVDTSAGKVILEICMKDIPYNFKLLSGTLLCAFPETTVPTACGNKILSSFWEQIGKSVSQESWGKKIVFNTLPKPKEEWKAVLSEDLRKFTSFTTRFLFPMLTLTSLFPFLSTQDWFTELDLKDVYFHNKNDQGSRKHDLWGKIERIGFV